MQLFNGLTPSECDRLKDDIVFELLELQRKTDVWRALKFACRLVVTYTDMVTDVVLCIQFAVTMPSVARIQGGVVLGACLMQVGGGGW